LETLGTSEAKAALKELVANERSWNRRRRARAVMRRFEKRAASGKPL
jgi:hypothetical protein